MRARADSARARAGYGPGGEPIHDGHSSGSFAFGFELSGFAIAVGGWLLLQMIGMGIGLARVDVDPAGELRGVGIGTSVWTLVAPIIAMFAGGHVGSVALFVRKRTDARTPRV